MLDASPNILVQPILAGLLSAILLGLAAPAEAQWTLTDDGTLEGPNVDGVQITFTCQNRRGASEFRFDSVPDLPKAEEKAGYFLHHARVKVSRFRVKVTFSQERRSAVLVDTKGTSLFNMRRLGSFRSYTLELPDRTLRFSLDGIKEPMRNLLESCAE